MQVCESYIHTYTADIRRSTYHILTWSVHMCTYMTSNEQYIFALSAAVHACISSTCIYRHCDGEDVCQYMHVYACISEKTCLYIEYVYERISNSISGSIFVCIFNNFENARGLCPFGLCPVRAVSAPSPRGRYGKFVARQRKRRQIATFRLSLRDWTAAASPCCALKCHDNLGWRSFTR